MDMQFSSYFNEDHEAIREVARDFANNTLAPLAADIDKNEKFPMEVVSQMAELGFLGLKIPEEYGGLGMDMRSYVCVMEEIARKCATATIFISSANGSIIKRQELKYVLPGFGKPARHEFYIAEVTYAPPVL